MRMIDADALLKFFVERQEMDRSGGEWADCFMNSAQTLSTEWWCVEDAVESAPTIDAVPVVHAKWEHCFEDWRHQLEGDKCSACGFEHYGIPIDHYLYCPNCGAKMDGGEHDVAD